MIAALYVHPDGVYFGLEGVDPWDAERDARKYDGPHRVIAHPPCTTWGALAKVNRARYGHPIGKDGGCFAHALWAVRTFGGSSSTLDSHTHGTGTASGAHRTPEDGGLQTISEGGHAA